MTQPRGSGRRGRSRSRRWMLRALVVGAAGTGIGSVLSGANAFTSGTVPRESTVNVAADDNAIIGLSIADSVQRKKQVRLADITNNGSEKYTLEVSLDPQTQGKLFGPNGSGNTVELTLNPGVTDTVEIETDEKKGTTIPFTISRSDPEFSFTINRQTTVKGGFEGPIELELSGTVKAPGGSGKYKFELKNTGDVKVKLRKIGIVKTTNTDPEADYVSGKGSLLGDSNNTTYVDEKIPIDNDTPDATLLEMAPKPVLGPQNDNDGESITFEFRKFQSDSDKNLHMKGEDVKIKLEVENLENDEISTGTVDLCIDTCDFSP